MTENETRLEQAIRRVAETKRLIAEQRQRIEKLRASGISTLDAEQTLDVLGSQDWEWWSLLWRIFRCSGSSTLSISSLPSLEKYEKYVREHPLKNAN